MGPDYSIATSDLPFVGRCNASAATISDAALASEHLAGVHFTGSVRGALEYQGQKCSAASRADAPKSLCPSFLAASCTPLLDSDRGGTAAAVNTWQSH